MKTKSLLIIVWTLWFVATPVWVAALPNGGNITAGDGSINSSGGNMTIQQNTQKMITNWQGFSIGAAESVTFNQPNTQAVSFNRVLGVDPSLIMGKMVANGRVFLSNPSGVLFGSGAQVDVNGLIATTLSMADQDFLDGNYNFFQDPTRSLASVINEGRITASGFVGLFAPAVENRGMIVANLGSVAMASGEAGTLDFTGDNLIRFAITEDVSGYAKDTKGKILGSRVRNSGTVQADGGIVTMSAWDAGQVIRNVVNNEGIIQARSVEKKNGEVILHGGSKGIVTHTGTIDVTGDDSGEKGGAAILLGQYVAVGNKAKIDASGAAGGGGILVGGILQGENPEIQNSQVTYIDKNATLKADATESGDGGGVIVYSDGESYIYGKISARGGPDGGNGGYVQTAGLRFLGLGQTPDLAAPNGVGGSWLIGPAKMDLVAGGGSNLVTDLRNIHSGKASPIGVDLITDALADGVDVTVYSFNDERVNEELSSSDSEYESHSGGINVLADIDFNGTKDGSLHIFGSNDVNIKANIFDSQAGDGDKLDLTLTADSDISGAGNVNIARGASINVENGDLGIAGDDVNIQGQLTSTNRVYVTSRDNETIGVDGEAGTRTVSNICDGRCGLTLGGDELKNINASGQGLVIGNGFNDDVYVSGVTADQTANQNITDFRSANDLRFVNTASVFSSRIRALPFGEIIVDAPVSGNDINFSSVGSVYVNADVTASNNFFSFLPLGDFHLAAGKNLTATNDVFLAANDVHLAGLVDAGQTVHVNNSENSKTIGLGDASGDLTLDNDEIANITADTLLVGDRNLDTTEIKVDGMEASHITNVGIQSATPGSFKGQITFKGSSKFNNLTLNAGDKILVDGHITTLGDFLASVNQQFLLGSENFPFTLDGVGTFELTADSSIISEGSLTILANELIIGGTLSGNPVTCSEANICVVPVETEVPEIPQQVQQLLEQGTQSTFINYFIEDAQTNC